MSPSAVSGSEFGDLAASLTSRHLSGLDQQAVGLGFALVRATSMYTQELERLIHRSRGWSFSGFRIMYMIWIFGEIEARDLARLAGVSRQATSTVLATLENNRMITRERTSDTDKRLIAVRLTPEGRKAIEEAYVEQNRLESEWFGELSDDERDTLKGLIDRLAIAISRRAGTAQTGQSSIR